MADISKAVKIAAGYKKLKQFQQKSRKTELKSKNNLENIENDVSSTNRNEQSDVSSNHSDCNNFTSNIDHIDNLKIENSAEKINNPPNLFQLNSSAFNDKSIFLDNTEFPSIQSYFDNNAEDFDQIIKHSVPFPAELPPEENNSDKINNFIKNTNEKIQEYQFSNQQILLNTNTSYSTDVGNGNKEYLTALPITEEQISNPTNLIEEQSSDQKKFRDTSNDSVNLSSIENIRQLSSEVKKLIDLSEDSPSTLIRTTQEELEYRNQELAGMLENRNIEVAQLTSRLQEYFNRIQDLENQLRTTQSEMTLKVQEELHPLKEKLEYHAQTIGVLVAEKSELSAALEKNQTIVKEKISENEEIQCKLRASRHRVSDLEREINSLKQTLDIRMKSQMIEDTDQLKLDLNDSKQRIDELLDEISELSQKLNMKSQECIMSKEELTEKNNQLSLLELKLHQVCNNETSQLEFQVENLTKEKLAMELKINHLAEELKSLTLEKNKTSEQYQQYVIQLNEQIKSFSLQLENLTKENEKLQKREVELVSHISNLEKEIQHLHQQKNAIVAPAQQKVDNELEQKLASLEKLMQDKCKEITILVEEKRDLLKELENRNYQIANLEEKIMDLENDRPNAARLAAVMESDKVAAAQAIKQNTKLTKQVEELQDKLIELTQRELSLTEKLGAEQHLGEEILKQFKLKENDIELLQKQLIEKEEKYLELQLSLQHKNVASEVEKTKIDIELNKKEFELLKTEDNNNPVIKSETVPVIKNGSKISQTENMMNDSALNVERKCNKCQENENFLNKMEAMSKLEERFKQTMEDVARLSEEKLELEHLVLQLQSETETIGEYVALYQFQRSVLKQRSLEKDEELRLLNQDREHMKQKLAELNSLIQQFVVEKNNTNIKESINLQTTQEHQEIHQEEKADKIMELISEINRSNLIEPKEYVSHICSLCSGKLITV